MLDITKIKQLEFPESQYYKTEIAKKQIVIHHTASGRGIDGDFTHWLTDPARIATAFIIGEDGTIYQLFSSKYWGHHLGLKSDFLKAKGFSDSNIRNNALNQASIAIEVDSWGPLTTKDGKFYSYTGTEVPASEVYHYEKQLHTIPSSKYNDSIGQSGKPAFYYQKYSDAQIESLRDLLEYLAKKFNIPVTYNEDMWNVSLKALRGNPGIFTHVSYRNDKSDCHPQDNLIQMLQTLKTQ